MDGAIENLDVGRQLPHQRMFTPAERCEAIGQRLQLLLQRRASFRRNFDPRWWNLANILCNVVARPIGDSHFVSEEQDHRKNCQLSHRGLRCGQTVQDVINIHANLPSPVAKKLAAGCKSGLPMLT